MRRLKKCLLSENGMRLVNTAFFLSVFVRRSGVIIAAYLLWMAYLYFVIKSTSSKAVRAVSRAFIVFAAVMMAVNAYMLMKSIF